MALCTTTHRCSPLQYAPFQSLSALFFVLTQGYQLMILQYILADKSKGLRASKAGQHGGGLSLCRTAPHEFGWQPYCGGEFRANLGRALWVYACAAFLLCF